MAGKTKITINGKFYDDKKSYYDETIFNCEHLPSPTSNSDAIVNAIHFNSSKFRANVQDIQDILESESYRKTQSSQY